MKANRTTLAFKIVKIYPHPVTFLLRFFKSERLLATAVFLGLPLPETPKELRP
jgi:hypothetical protein